METSYVIEADSVILRLNPKVYNLDMAYATAYPFLDRMWILFDGDPHVEIIIKARAKQPGADLNRFANEFLNELVSISNYFKQFEINRDVINAVLQRALFSASPATAHDARSKEIDSILDTVDQKHPAQQPPSEATSHALPK